MLDKRENKQYNVLNKQNNPNKNRKRGNENEEK